MHPFPLTVAPLDLASLTLELSADREQREFECARTVNAVLLRQRLAGLLGCTDDQIDAAYGEATLDWTSWVRRLLDHAQVEGLIMDPAWQNGGSVEPFRALTGRPVWELLRIDPIIDRLLATEASASDVVKAVEDAIENAAAAGCVGLKSVLAYRTGLAVDPEASLHDAQSSLRESGPLRRRGKALRDLVLRRALARCVDLDLPIQLHTGFGDSDLRPMDANPLLLDGLLRTPEGQAAQLVLIHGAWPWHDEVAYLAMVHSNVVVEFSLAQLFAPLTTDDRLVRLVEAVPMTRLLVGSDGHGSPESIWFGCLMVQDAWSRVQGLLVESGVPNSWVADAELAIFGGNATRIYHLSGRST